MTLGTYSRVSWFCRIVWGILKNSYLKFPLQSELNQIALPLHVFFCLFVFSPANLACYIHTYFPSFFKDSELAWLPRKNYCIFQPPLQAFVAMWLTSGQWDEMCVNSCLGFNLEGSEWPWPRTSLLVWECVCAGGRGTSCLSWCSGRRENCVVTVKLL